MVPLLRKCNPHRTAARLTAEDVRQIRYWVRTEGFGLSIQDQVRALMALPFCAGMKSGAVREVVTGETWADPSYDRSTPLTVHTPSPVNPLLLVILMMWLAFRNRSCVVSIMPGILAGYYDAQAD